MQRQQARRYSPPSSFWEDFAEYLLGEVREILKILGIIALAIYLLISMLVGMYQVFLYILWLCWKAL
jgi:hypothetical protein